MSARSLNDNDSQVLTALGGSERPLSAYDILDRARSDALKAPVQVYRALEKLQERGLVHRIEALNAFIACSEHGAGCGEGEHRHPRHRPGFVICRQCGSVREFEDGRVGEIAGEAAGADFAVDLVSLEIYGRCGSCRTEAGGAEGAA